MNTDLDFTITLSEVELDLLYWLLRDHQSHADEYLKHGSEDDPALYETIVKTISQNAPHIAAIIAKLEPALNLEDNANDDKTNP